MPAASASCKPGNACCDSCGTDNAYANSWDCCSDNDDSPNARCGNALVWKKRLTHAYWTVYTSLSASKPAADCDAFSKQGLVLWHISDFVIRLIEFI